MHRLRGKNGDLDVAIDTRAEEGIMKLSSII